MNRLSIAIIIAVSIFSCSASPSKIRVFGHIDGVENGIVEIADGYFWETKVLDSTQIINGNFDFTLNTAKDFEPSLVTLVFRDRSGRKQRIIFDTPSHTGVDNRKYQGATAFMLEPGSTEISGTVKGYSMYSVDSIFNSKITFRGEKQSEAYFANSELDQVLGNDEKTTISILERAIKNYPDSYFVLSTLRSKSRSVSKANLSMLLGKFSQSLIKSKTGLSIAQVLANEDVGSPVSKPIMLFSQEGKTVKVDLSSGNTLIVFWASWCGPCISEATLLEKILPTKPKSWNIIAISLDDTEAAWKSKWDIHGSHWMKTWVGKDSSAKENLMQMFRVSSIPVIVAYKSGKEVYRHSGLSSNDSGLLATDFTRIALTKE